MIIRRVVKNTEDGSYSAELQLSAEQTAFLINFAIGYLVQEGTVKIFDLKEGESLPEGEEAKEFLQNLDPETLSKA